MRKFYRGRRNRVVEILKNCPFASRLEILELDAGLHFLLKVDTQFSDRVLTEKLLDRGIKIHPLSHYYHASGDDTHCFVVNYGQLEEDALREALSQLPFPPDNP